MDTRQIRLALGKGMETRLAAMLVQVASQYESSVPRTEPMRAMLWMASRTI